MVTMKTAAGSAALPRTPSGPISGCASDTAAVAEARKPARVIPTWIVDRKRFGSSVSAASFRPRSLSAASRFT